MAGSLLITRPAYEIPTHYLARWSDAIISEAKAHGTGVIDLDRTKATRKRVLGILQKKQQERMLVVFNGHGNEMEVFGHDGEMLLGPDDTAALAGNIVYARACSSAAGLGPKAVQDGALAYIGYDTEFTILIEEDKAHHPEQDQTAALFLEPSNYVAVALLKGHSAGEANERSRRKFRDNIRRLMHEGPSAAHYYAIQFLFGDMSHQVCVGSPTATL